MSSSDWIVVLLAVLPLLAGGLVAGVKPPGFVTWLDQRSEALERRREKILGRKGWWNRLFSRPAYWMLTRVAKWSCGIGDLNLRAGVRVAGYLYVGVAVIFLGFFVAYLLVAVVLILLMIWILSYALTHGTRRPDTEPDEGRPDLVASGAKLKNRWGGAAGRADPAILGNDLIIRDKAGSAIGRMSKAVFGNEYIVEKMDGSEIGRFSRGVFDAHLTLKDDQGRDIARIVTDADGSQEIVVDSDLFEAFLKAPKA